MLEDKFKISQLSICCCFSNVFASQVQRKFPNQNSEVLEREMESLWSLQVLTNTVSDSKWFKTFIEPKMFFGNVFLNWELTPPGCLFSNRLFSAKKRSASVQTEAVVRWSCFTSTTERSAAIFWSGLCNDRKRLPPGTDISRRRWP